MPKFPIYKTRRQRRPPTQAEKDAYLKTVEGWAKANAEKRKNAAHDAFKASNDFADKYHISVIEGMLKDRADNPERHDAAVSAWDKAVAFSDKYHMSVLEGILS